jgi:hypothetical protein
VIEQFIADNIEHAVGGHVGKRILNSEFKSWFVTNYTGKKIPKLMELEMAMNEKFEVKTNKKGMKEWINIKIKRDELGNDCDLDEI